MSQLLQRLVVVGAFDLAAHVNSDFTLLGSERMPVHGARCWAGLLTAVQVEARAAAGLTKGLLLGIPADAAVPE